MTTPTEREAMAALNDLQGYHSRESVGFEKCETLRAYIAAHQPEQAPHCINCGMSADPRYEWEGQFKAEIEGLNEAHIRWHAAMRRQAAKPPAPLNVEAAQEKVPDGWKLVPVEPTAPMRDSGVSAANNKPQWSIRAVWAAMLAAAPSVPFDFGRTISPSPTAERGE